VRERERERERNLEGIVIGNTEELNEVLTAALPGWMGKGCVCVCVRERERERERGTWKAM
jgi:hypothetical protein